MIRIALCVIGVHRWVEGVVPMPEIRKCVRYTKCRDCGAIRDWTYMSYIEVPTNLKPQETITLRFNQPDSGIE